MQRKYQFAVIATDTVILTVYEGQLKVLLIKMKKTPYQKHWAVPGGLVKGNESVDACAARQLLTKAGIKNVYLEQLYTFGKVNRDPFGRVVSVAYYALIPHTGIKLFTSDEYADIGWFNIKDLPKLAYDHKEIIQTALVRLQSKLQYTNAVCSLLPEFFTLPELHAVYEIILSKKFDRRNFRKRMLNLKLIKKTGRKVVRGANRPADVYRFSSRKLQNIEIL